MKKILSLLALTLLSVAGFSYMPLAPPCNTPPTINCPANITVNNDPGICGAVVNYSTPTATDNCFSCPAGASISGYTYMGTFGGHYYYRSNATTSWTSANSAAVGLGGYLATIGSAAENAFVSSNVPSYGWLGLTDQATEGIFVWANGEPFVYANFCNAEPNNNGNEDYIVINWCPVGLDGPAAGKGWNDLADFNSTLQTVAVVEFDCIPVTVTRTAGPASGSTFPVGTTTVTYKATDGAGNSASCSFTVTVIDNEAPTITCPGNITVNNDPGVCGAVVNYTEPIAIDNCSMCDITSLSGYTYLGKYNGHSYFISNTTSQWAAANTAAQSVGAHLATVTSAGEQAFIAGHTSLNAWIGLTDQAVEGTFVWVTGEPLSYTNWCSGEPNNGPGGNEDWAIINGCGPGPWNDGSNNPCCPQRAIIEFECGAIRTSGPASGTTFPVGTTTVTYSATDASNNTGTCSFTVTVADNEPPVISCPGNVTIACTADNTPAGTGTATATDNCGVASITPSDVITPGNCAGNYTITRTWAATDVHNKSSSCTQTITVQDLTGPVITCPGNVTIACTADNTPAGTGTATATDDCSGVASITHSDVTAAGNCLGNYTITRTWTATDGCGNPSSCTQIITARDQTGPTAICQNVTVTLSGGSATVTPGMVNNGSFDDCSGIGSMSLSKTSFNCSNIGANQVTLTVTDACGNSSSCTATVTVVGTILTCSIMVTPSNNTYTGGVPTNIYLGYGPQSATITVTPGGGSGFTYSWSGPTAYLSCDDCANPVFTPTTGGTHTYTVTVTNSDGCTTTCTVTFCVKDIRVPGNGNNGKVYICHVPSGNPTNANTLSISTNAVPSHLPNHGGDYLGQCGQTCGSPVNARLISGSSGVIGDEVRIYPNPNTGSFVVEIPYTDAEQSLITVTDVQGKVIQRKVVTDNDGRKITLHLGDVARGMYLVEVIYGDQRFRTKLIVR